MTSCAFRKCKNNTKNTSKASGITFHCFPTRNPVIYDKWASVVRKEKGYEDWIPSKYSRVCSNHFDESDFNVSIYDKRKLKISAVPKQTQSHGNEQPSTLTVGVSNKSAAFYGKRVASLLESDDDKRNTESEQETAKEPVDVHYTSSKESQKGKTRLSSGSLFPETPAFSLTQELVKDLHELSDKIQNFYPAALGKQFTLTFQGEDGEKSEYIFTSASKTRRSGESHNSLCCNECGSNIVGFLYKCVSCVDYDLCSACESLGLHADHLMMRTARPIKLKRARMLLQQWCKAMKAVGITTAEELPCSQNEEPQFEPRTPPSSSSKSLVLEPTPRSPSSTKAAKGKGEVKATNNSTPADEPKKNEAKKRKIEEKPEEDHAIITDVAIKEETIEDFYKSMSESDEENETEIFISTEEMKTDDPDPLGTDKIKVEDMEVDRASSSTPPGHSGPDTVTSRHPGPAPTNSGHLEPATITSGHPEPAITSGHPGPSTTTSRHHEPANTSSRHTGPATTTSGEPGTATTTSGHPGPAQ